MYFRILSKKDVNQGFSPYEILVFLIILRSEDVTDVTFLMMPRYLPGRRASRGMGIIISRRVQYHAAYRNTLRLNSAANQCHFSQVNIGY